MPVRKSAILRLVERRCGRLERRLVPAYQDDFRRAVGSVCRGDGEADAPGGAGYEGCFALESGGGGEVGDVVEGAFGG